MADFDLAEDPEDDLEAGFFGDFADARAADDFDFTAFAEAGLEAWGLTGAESDEDFGASDLIGCAVVTEAGRLVCVTGTGAIWGCAEGMPNPVDGVCGVTVRKGVGGLPLWDDPTICGNCGVLVSTMISPHLSYLSEKDRLHSVP